MTAAPAIALRGAAVERGGRVVWSHGDLAVPEGSIVAVIGPNGSGKTTFLRVLLGLQPVLTGDVEVLGRRPRRGDPRIGYVAQRIVVTMGEAVRVQDLVTLGITGRRWGLARSRPTDRQRVDRALGAVGADHLATRRLSALSGGEQQRVALASALVAEPELLLLDEPLANLDVRSQHQLVGVLGRVAAERRMTVVVVVHDLNSILSVADGVVYLLDGHLHYGLVDEVVDAELLTHLYGTPVRVVRTAQGDLFTKAGS